MPESSNDPAQEFYAQLLGRPLGAEEARVLDIALGDRENPVLVAEIPGRLRRAQQERVITSPEELDAAKVIASATRQLEQAHPQRGVLTSDMLEPGLPVDMTKPIHSYDFGGRGLDLPN